MIEKGRMPIEVTNVWMVDTNDGSKPAVWTFRPRLPDPSFYLSEVERATAAIKYVRAEVAEAHGFTDTTLNLPIDRLNHLASIF